MATDKHPPGVGEYFHHQGYRKKVGHLLNVEQVIQIFAMLSCNVPVYDIGCHFGVSSHMVYMIKRGERWAWVRDKLLEEAEFEPDILHRWIPDVHREGEFCCRDCGMAYSQLMMKTKCPVRQKDQDSPLYMTWEIPKPKMRKMKEPKKKIAGADLKAVREYNEKKKKFEETEGNRFAEEVRAHRQKYPNG